MEGESENVLNLRWPLRGNFNKQVGQILYRVRMSRLEVEALQVLYDDIQHIVNTIWPGCTLEAFGSIVTGLALKSSDVDCMVKLPPTCHDAPASCAEKFGNFIANNSGPLRHESVNIKRVPVVKFFHPETGRHCDLSFNGPTAVEFSKLVGYLVTVDARILKLTTLIKCWAKVQKVTGPKRFPSNALLILIIFFLQYKNLLPPIASLQRNSPVNLVNGWNTAFEEITNYRPSDELDLYNLLSEFFAYYSEFDFRNLIVCPFLGYPIERSEFRNVNSVPEDFQLYKEKLNAGDCENIFLTCIICVQDPFDHARNCAGCVRPQVAGEVIACFQGAAYVCAATQKNEVLEKLLTYQYSEPARPECSRRWKLSSRYRCAARSKVERRSTPRSRAYRARGKNFRKTFEKNLTTFTQHF